MGVLLIRDLDTLRDRESEGFEVGVGRFGVGDELEVADPQGAEDLGSGAVFDHFWGEGFGDRVFLGVLVWSRESVGEGIAYAVGSEVDDRASSLGLDHFHRGLKGLTGRVGRVAVERIEDVSEQITLVDADEGGGVVGDGIMVFVEGADIADGEREVGHGIAR